MRFNAWSENARSPIFCTCNLFAPPVSYSITTMIYTTLFLIGLLGLVAQAFLGLSHGGHAHAGHSHTGHAHSGHEQHDNHTSERGLSALWTLLSPLTLFSLCLGAGATGLLARSAHLAPLLAGLLALLGGLVFYGLLVRPIWTVMFRFASKPSQALEGMVAQQAQALGHFDARGRGLVGLTIDGQWVRVLAVLETEDRTETPGVQPGDQLTVTSVDGRSNTCHVARL
jgi:hypothetical protein